MVIMTPDDTKELQNRENTLEQLKTFLVEQLIDQMIINKDASDARREYLATLDDYQNFVLDMMKKYDVADRSELEDYQVVS